MGAQGGNINQTQALGLQLDTLVTTPGKSAHLGVDGDCGGGGNAHDRDLALIHVGALSDAADVRILRTGDETQFV